MSSNRDKGLQFSNQQARNDNRNADVINKMFNDNKQVFIAWWASFNDKYPDFDQADYSSYPDPSLVNEINQYANENGIKTVSVNNVDQLLEYAVMVFTSVVALKAIDYISKSLKDEAKVTADFGAKLYDQAVEQVGKDILDIDFSGQKWSKRIWKSQSKLRTDLSNIMRSALLDAENPTTYIQAIKDKYGVSSYQAERILRTEGARVSAAQQAKSAIGAGYDKLEWATGAGACRYCSELDGKQFKASKFGSGKWVIPRHPNCRCTVIAAGDTDIDKYI